MKAKVKPGDEVTAMYSRLAERHVLLLRVTKVGRKYLHGVTLWVEQDGSTRDGHETKVILKLSAIYKGLRHDLRDAEFKYREDYRKWKLQKQERQNEIEWDLRDLVREKLHEWVQNHPMPQPPEFPAPSVGNR